MKQLAQLESVEEAFRKRQAALWAIAAQKASPLSDPAGLLQKPRWFPILLDTNRRVTKAYGVYHALGVDAFRIARPAAFVVGRDGRIAFSFVSSNQFERVALEDLLSALEKA
ncbi:MAG: redoxin domain-containing protein [Acidobacteria bacterium]|nr:redoxin domain-containing protein [Acidobacteriota bacterium]MCI0568855.1 redoxin domain-containing protein [Acidobacteriota bacterium]MCI0655881.1 redoxin domain-containing protein [Acidobacteriota bacterium]